MRLAVRLLQPSEAPSLQISKSLLYVCSNCRQEFLPRSSLSLQTRRNVSGNISFTEKVRRKLWGTDRPPGLKDPYGGQGVIETAFGKRPEPQEEEEQFNEEVAPPQEYTPATTWDGIPRIGHLGRWSDMPSTPNDEYVGFMSSRKLVKKELIQIAAHQTTVELCLLHELKKPLTDICSVLEHDRSVFRAIYKCKINPVENSGNLNSRLTFPSKEAQTLLFYVFKQLGSNIVPEAEAEKTTGEVSENVEENVEEDAEEDAEEVPQGPIQPFFGVQQVRDTGFTSISLKDPAVKFAFLKRFSQITGHLLPDSVIGSMQSVNDVVDHLQQATNPPPKKLAEQLKENKSLDLPNVKIFAKKRRRSHQDQELGLKKLIDAELYNRGLLE